MKRPRGFDETSRTDGREISSAKNEQRSPAVTRSRPLVPAQPVQIAAIEPIARSEAVASLADSPVSLPEQSLDIDSVHQARDELRRAERLRRERERKEQRRFTSHIRAARRRWLVVIATVVGLALFVVAGVFTPIMAVDQIRIEGAGAVNATDLETALSRFEGVPLALVSDQDVHRALEPFPLVQRYAVERIPPHTLIVRIEERTPTLAFERESGFDLLDPAGVLLGNVSERPAGVPLGGVELGDPASPAFREAAAIVRDMPDDLRQLIVAVTASNPQSVALVFDTGTEVVWGDRKNMQRKASVLRSLLSAIGSPTTIDVSAPEAPVFSN